MRKLRNDITGLRAIAVLAVTIFHICQSLYPNSNFLRGGFVGVDVFFVISGFLMTKIIYTGIEKNNFSLTTFYQNRAKRICPSLFITILLFLVVYYFIFGVGDLKKYAFDSLCALLFISNISFAQNTDYFAASSLNQPLLHTWSLSVEWQFYIFYPVILLLIAKTFGRDKLKNITTLLTIVLTIFGIWYTTYNPKESYFMTYSRSFELLIGALAFFYPIYTKRVSKKNLELLGLSLILISCIIINEDNHWPTAFSLLPCLGAYICIATNNEDTVLKNVIIQKIGLYSYSIYLMHYPILVVMTNLGFDAFVLQTVLLILISAIIIYHVFETRRNYGYIFLAFYTALCSISYYFSLDGAPYRVKHIVPEGSLYGGKTITNEGDVRIEGNKDKRPLFIISGDSFSRHYMRDLLSRGIKVYTVFKDGCYSYSSAVSKRPEGIIDPKCEIRYKNLVEIANKNPHLRVMIAQDWQRYEKSLYMRSNHEQKVEDFYKQLALDIEALSKDMPKSKIYLITNPYQTFFDIGATCMYLHRMDNIFTNILKKSIPCNVRKDLHSPKIIKLNSYIKETAKAYKNIKVINPNDAICDDTNCQIMTDDFVPIYQDGLHYSIAGSKKVVSYILKEMDFVRTSRHENQTFNEDVEVVKKRDKK